MGWPMSRWFRSYADTHRNPKVAGLSDADFRLWHQLLCIAAENEGLIPPLEALKSLLKRRLDHLKAAIERLVKEGLIDPSGKGFAPHNWLERQYKSDCSTDRVKRFRNGGGNVSETPPDTETDTEEEKVVGGKPPSYAFFGQTIRLTPRHLSEWQRLFHSIPDLQAELSVLDGWWQSQPEDKRTNWFHATKAMLNKKHQSNLAEEKKLAANGGWDGMP
jgi:hypothetical protein